MDPPTKTLCQKLGVLRKVGGSGPPDPPVVAPLTVDISEDIVLKHINKCKPGTAAGPDGIPNSFFKMFKFNLVTPLTVLFKYLLNLGNILCSGN